MQQDTNNTEVVKPHFETLLIELLNSQDMGEKNAIRLTDDLVHGCFSYKTDPISGIIGNAVISNRHDDNYDEMISDISYAINQLNRAKSILQRINK